MRRRAFSLAEMMIAIVILGLGMLMAATMFPVGWLRARDLADFTNSSAATSTAATTVQLLAHVSSALTETSFLGDDDESATVGYDTYVHVLHIENRLFKSEVIMGESLYEGTDLTIPLTTADFIDVDPTVTDDWVANAVVPPVAQVAFHERVFPSLQAYPLTGAPANEFERWEDQLLSRRFAWAVLHRLEEVPGGPGEPLSMAAYIFTLRRTQSTHRFARQDPNETSLEPKALAADEDVFFPAPWLIALTIDGNWDATGLPADPLGIPSEAKANDAALGAEGKLIAQMLLPGSVLIDRLVGHVYTVRQQRFTGTGDEYDYRAALTLDREISEVDLGLVVGANVQIDVHDDGVAGNLGGNVRDFWVFPPPVTRTGDGADDFIFDGQQPVVSIETRQMAFSP